MKNKPKEEKMKTKDIKKECLVEKAQKEWDKKYGKNSAYLMGSVECFCPKCNELHYGKKKTMKTKDMNTKQEILEAFEKKFVVKAGTKRVKRVGHYATASSDIPSAAYWEDVKSFFSKAIDKAVSEEGERIRKGLEKQKGVGHMIGEKIDDYISRAKAIELTKLKP